MISDAVEEDLDAIVELYGHLHEDDEMPSDDRVARVWRAGRMTASMSSTGGPGSGTTWRRPIMPDNVYPNVARHYWILLYFYPCSSVPICGE
jgi:hypothetical protein